MGTSIFKDKLCLHDIEVLRYFIDSDKTTIFYRIYTRDFVHFVIKRKQDSSAGTRTYHVGHTVDISGRSTPSIHPILKLDENGKIVEYEIGKILATKKFMFHNLLRKYVIVSKIFALPEITNIITSLMGFEQELITVI